MLKILISVVLIIVLNENIAVAYDLGDKDEAFIEQVDRNCSDTMAEQLMKRIEDLEGNMIENKEKIKALEDENTYLRTKSHGSCYELKTNDYTESGYYWIDPDNSGHPVKVFCDMETGATEVGHRQEGAHNITWCKEEGCYSLDIEYNLPEETIQAIIAMSDNCEQEIIFQCKMAPLKNPAFKFNYGWWVDRNEEKQFHFDGSDADKHVCGCYKDNSCPMSSFNTSCHCDSSLMPLWNTDSGKIMNKDSLPVKQFKYGSFFSEYQAAKVTIGRLRCVGPHKSEHQLVSTCTSLKKGGISADGFYLLKDAPEDALNPGFCALSKNGYTEEELRMESKLRFQFEKITFNITSFECFSCESSSFGSNNYHWVKDIEVQSSTEHPNISIEKDEGSFLFHTEGLYVIFWKSNYQRLYLRNIQIGQREIKWIEANEKIRFKTTYNYRGYEIGQFSVKRIL